MPASAKVQSQDAIGGTIGGTDRTGEIKRDAKKHRFGETNAA